MLPTEPLDAHELAQHHRELRNESRAYARAMEQAKADPCRTYQCPECRATDSTLGVIWHGRDCLRVDDETGAVCPGVMVGVVEAARQAQKGVAA